MKRLLLIVLFLASATVAHAQSEQLKLTWTDNATNEDGTKIERGPTNTGPFVEIFSLIGANLVSFTDNNLPQATEFFYRVRAFNAGGFSGYSNVASAITPAVLTVQRIGAGQGAISSAPIGLSCGSTCTARFSGRSSVILTASVTLGSQFDGWSGACTGTSLTCSVTMDGAKNVTASFSAISVPAAPTGLTTTPVIP